MTIVMSVLVKNKVKAVGPHHDTDTKAPALRAVKLCLRVSI